MKMKMKKRGTNFSKAVGKLWKNKIVMQNDKKAVDSYHKKQSYFILYLGSHYLSQIGRWLGHSRPKKSERTLLLYDRLFVCYRYKHNDWK